MLALHTFPASVPPSPDIEEGVLGTPRGRTKDFRVNELSSLAENQTAKNFDFSLIRVPNDPKIAKSKYGTGSFKGGCKDIIWIVTGIYRA